MVVFTMGAHQAKKGEGEDVRISSVRLHPDPHPFFLPDDPHPPRKYHHSMQNLILHLTQAFGTLAQV